MLRHATGHALANRGTETRTLQAYLGHRNISNTVRYTELAPGRFKNLWKDCAGRSTFWRATGTPAHKNTPARKHVTMACCATAWPHTLRLAPAIGRRRPYEPPASAALAASSSS
jgi:hypothetical protein